jgi:hypothetical protein
MVMESDLSPDILLTHLDWNIQHLGEVLKQDSSDYFRGAALQRFGLTGDSAFKCMQTFAMQNGETCNSLEECVQLAAKKDWLNLNDTWTGLISAYDKISRIGKVDDLPLDVFQGLGEYHIALKDLHANLLKRV